MSLGVVNATGGIYFPDDANGANGANENGGDGGSGGADGITESKSVVVDVKYDLLSHKLLQLVETWTFENGLLVDVQIPEEYTEITEAVPHGVQSPD